MARSGFVYVQDRTLALDGSTFRHIGVNCPNLAYYEGWQGKETQLAAARDMGARVIRIFAGRNDLSHSAAAAYIRNLADLALYSYGLRLLVSFTNLYSGGQHPQGDDRYYENVSGWYVLGSAFFYGGFRENYLPWVRELVGALRNHPGVFAWEIGNELKFDPDPQAFVNFAQEVVQTIRGIDPDHLITSGLMDVSHPALSQSQALALYQGMDIVSVHCYGRDHSKNDLWIADSLGLAHIVGEAGHPKNGRGDDLTFDLNDWFNNLGSDGYYQWGFMATPYDNGDGDRLYGMDHVFFDDWDTLFAIYRAFANYLGTGPPPPPPRYTCINGECVADASGEYGSLNECLATCQPPGQATAGIPWALLLGLAMGAAGFAVLAAARLGITPELEVVLSPGQRVVDVREINEGEPVPPGYRVVG